MARITSKRKVATNRKTGTSCDAVVEEELRRHVFSELSRSGLMGDS